MAKRRLTTEDRDNMAATGQRLAKVLHAYQWTQTDLANALGIKASTVNEWLSGKKLMDVNLARAIRALLDVSLDYLYCGDHGSLPLDLSRAIRRGTHVERAPPGDPHRSHED